MTRRLTSIIALAISCLLAVALTGCGGGGGGGGYTDNGRLTTSSTYSGGYYGHVYTYVADHTGSVTMDLTSGDFDPVLAVGVSTSSGAVILASNDDYGGSTNSHLSMTVSSGTTYYIVVSTAYTGATGSYTLTISDNVSSVSRSQVVPLNFGGTALPNAKPTELPTLPRK